MNCVPSGFFKICSPPLFANCVDPDYETYLIYLRIQLHSRPVSLRDLLKDLFTNFYSYNRIAHALNHGADDDQSTDSRMQDLARGDQCCIT